MNSSVPRTALPGQSRSSHDRLAVNLGFFSIALGMAEVMMPKVVCRAAGLEGQEPLVRAYGAREIATGLAILTSHDPTPWIWGRVAGDIADMATAAKGLQDGNPRKDNTKLALAALAAVTVVDVLCASGLSTEKGSRLTATADYSDRTGWPRGVDQARGAARDFRLPDDMRTPEALRPYGSA